MVEYKSFLFFVKDDVLFVKDPRINTIVMMRSVQDIEDKTEYGKSMIDQYISDCMTAHYNYENWVRHNLTGKQYREWRKSNT